MWVDFMDVLPLILKISLVLTSVGELRTMQNIPSKNIQKYTLARSDFAKVMQTDISNYVIGDRINDASFR